MPILPLLLPARRSVLPALLAAAILATAPVATALPIEILSAFQSVDAEAEALQGFQRSAQQRADGDDGAASADFAVDALAAIASAGAAASALLETQLTDRLLAGGGAGDGGGCRSGGSIRPASGPPGRRRRSRSPDRR